MQLVMFGVYKFLIFDLVVFNDISILVGNLMPNPIYIYI